MFHFFKSLFSSTKSKETSEESKRKNDEKNFDILKYDGIRAQRIGKTAYAIKCYSEALNIKEDFETMNQLVTAYTAIHEFDEALHTLDRMIALEPDHINTLLMRVNLLFMLDKEDYVIEECARIIELEEGNHTAYYLMAKAQKLTKDPIGAIGNLTKATTIKDDFTEAYLLRGEILLSIDQGKEALADIQKAIQLAPDEETSYLLRGRIYEALDNPNKAMADYHQVLHLNPFNEEACLLTGSLLIKQENLDEAIAFFNDAIDLKPDFAKAYSERGRAKNLQGDKHGAIEDLKKAIELSPEGEEAQALNGEHSNFNDLYKGGIF